MRLLHLLLALTLALFSAVTFAQAIDINTATAEELAKGVKGLGTTKAAAIVKYREAHGPFQSVHDLTKVKGIKEKALEGLLADKRNQLTVGEVAKTPDAPATPAAAPATPAMPAVPATAPAMPATPAIPAAPAKPAAAVPATAPAAPAMPAVPATPAMPAVPATAPAAPAAPPKP